MSVVQDFQPVSATETHTSLDAAHLIEGSTGLSKRLRWSEAVKCTIDFVIALVLLIVTAPIVFLAAIAVKLSSRGPVFYCQTRTGKDGIPFTIFKIRTMTHNCESKSGACWSVPGDPRITWVGRWLRRTHIDELPQLWNILRGDMSLVGPRPERPEFVVRLEQVFPDYRKRLAIKPGLSGLAQIQLPPDSDLESVRRKLVYDNYYVDCWTIWMDLRIIFSTICKVLHIPVSWSQIVLQLPSGSQVEGAEPARTEERTVDVAIQVIASDKPILAGCESAASFSSVS